MWHSSGNSAVHICSITYCHWLCFFWLQLRSLSFVLSTLICHIFSSDLILMNWFLWLWFFSFFFDSFELFPVFTDYIIRIAHCKPCLLYLRCLFPFIRIYLKAFNHIYWSIFIEHMMTVCVCSFSPFKTESPTFEPGRKHADCA